MMPSGNEISKVFTLEAILRCCYMLHLFIVVLTNDLWQEIFLVQMFIVATFQGNYILTYYNC